MKLTKKQQDMLWGGEGPYSEAKLVFETRILDDRVSRTFINVVVAINPTTFEICKDNADKFAEVPVMQQLFGNARNEGRAFGYVAHVFSESYDRENEKETQEVFKEAQIALEYSEKAIILLHEYVMEFLEL